MFEAKVATLVEPLHLQWEVLALDEKALEPDEIFARTLFSTISPGTEVAAYTGMAPLRPGKIYPRLVGYCNVAEIVATGSEVKTLSPGDHILTLQSHRSAFICPAASVLSVLPGACDLATVSSTYLFHLGYAALLRTGFMPGHTVAVVGLGPVGLGSVAVAAIGGASPVGYSDQADLRRRAEAMGAGEVRPKDESSPDFDIVISTSNKWPDWLLALKLARNGGSIAVLGFPGRGQPPPLENPLASRYLYDKQLAVFGCGLLPNLDVASEHIRFTVKRNMQWLASMVGSGRIDARQLLSETQSPACLDSLYQRLSAREAGLVTAVLDWNDG